MKRGVLLGLGVAASLGCAAVSAVAATDHARLVPGRFTVTYEARQATEQFHNNASGPATCQDPASEGFQATVNWMTAWRRLTLPERPGHRAAAKTTPRLSGSWGYFVPNYCAPGTVWACDATIAGNGRPATLLVTETRSSYRLTLEAMPAHGIRATKQLWQGARCSLALRYPAFEAVVRYRIATLRKMEHTRPRGFTVVTPVAVTDPQRRRIPYGAPRYTCGPSCYDDVSWAGKVILTYHGSRARKRR